MHCVDRLCSMCSSSYLFHLLSECSRRSGVACARASQWDFSSRYAPYLTNMMLSFVSGKDGNEIFRGSHGQAQMMVPQRAEIVIGEPIQGERAVLISWRFSASECLKEPKLAAVRITLDAAHASPPADQTAGGTAGSRGEQMYQEAQFAMATFVDVPVGDDYAQGSWRLELPSDTDLLTAADSVKPDARGAGSNLPIFEDRRADGSTRLRLRVKLCAISAMGAMGWGECESASWEHTVDANADRVGSKEA